MFKCLNGAVFNRLGLFGLIWNLLGLCGEVVLKFRTCRDGKGWRGGRGTMLEALLPEPHCRRIKSESLGVKYRHQCFKNSR